MTSSAEAHDTKEPFDQLAQVFSDTAGVTLPGESNTRGFGSNALRFGGSIFAMYVRGNLVVKLPSERVNALVADGQAAYFSANRGRPMKEWAVLLTDDAAKWKQIAGEALQFVRTNSH